jgi:hypothetical protein
VLYPVGMPTSPLLKIQCRRPTVLATHPGTGTSTGTGTGTGTGSGTDTGTGTGTGTGIGTGTDTGTGIALDSHPSMACMHNTLQEKEKRQKEEGEKRGRD